MHHALPATKQLPLTEYVDTIRGGDAPVPAVAVAILPPSASAEEDDEDEVVNMEK